MIRFEEALVHHQAFDGATDQVEWEDHIVEVESPSDLKIRLDLTWLTKVQTNFRVANSTKIFSGFTNFQCH